MASPNKNPSSSMRMLQEHLAWKRRSSKPAAQIVNKPISSSNVVAKTISDNVTSSELTDDDEEYEPSRPNNYELLQIKFLKDEEAHVASLRDKPVVRSAKDSVPNLMNIIDLDD